MTIGRPPRTLEQRKTLFSQQCEVQDNGCVLWMGRVDKDGYGRLNIEGKKVRVHRMALQWSGVHVPSDLLVMHTCDTPRCVNPAHLQVGTVLQNVRDCISKKRDVKLWGERHSASKLTEEQVRQIRASDLSSRDAAPLFDVTARTIRDIRSRRRWRHLP